MNIKSIAALDVFLQPSYGILMPEVQLEIGLFNLLQSIESLELLFSQRINDFIYNLSYACLKVKPVDAYLGRHVIRARRRPLLYVTDLSWHSKLLLVLNIHRICG